MSGNPIVITAVTSSGLTLTGTFSVTPSAGVLYGSCPPQPGSVGIAQLFSQVPAKMVRCYDGNQPASMAGTSEAQYAPKGVPLFLSSKPDITAVAARDASTLGELHSEYGGLEDIPNQRACIWHEGEKDSLNPVTFKAAWTPFLDVLDALNKSRRYPILGVPTFEGWSLLTHAQGGPSTWRDIAGTWLPSDPRITEVGFDCYSYPEIQASATFAALRRLNWCIPEYGWSANGGTIGDAAYAAQMRSDESLWTSVSVPPRAVLLYNRGADALMGQTQATAYWAGLCAG
jgi:hypothetical protein